MRNVLAQRDPASIAALEASFTDGVLAQAAHAAPWIERRVRLDPETFAREHRRALRPVVVEGLLADWPALATWSFDHLAARVGGARVVVAGYHATRARSATFAEFVAEVRAGGPPIYLQEWLFMADCPALATDLPELPIAQYDFCRQLYGERVATNHQLWIGQRGATTRLHQDSYFVDVMHAQIVGEKHWCVMAPEACAPDFASLAADPATRLMQCVLKPGDVLYLPALWWHRVVLRSDSIGLGRKCLDEVNLRRHVRARLGELLALALNHDHVKAAFPDLYGIVV